MKNYFDLTGQVAIITGCSTGLGVQMAAARVRVKGKSHCGVREQRPGRRRLQHIFSSTLILL